MTICCRPNITIQSKRMSARKSMRVRKPCIRIKEEHHDHLYYESSSSDEELVSVQTHQRKSASSRKSTTGSDEYSNRRMRNNLAVRKSRAKMRSLKEDALDKMTAMTSEKDELESMMGSLSDEIKMLKDVLIGITGGFPSTLLDASLSSSIPSSPEPETIDLSNLKYFEFAK